jgi:Leucine Rich Repeat (LRR) protein
MSSITKFSNGQETISHCFSLARKGDKEEAISALNTPGNGIPKALRRQIERDIQENTNTESLNGLEQKHIALLGSPKEHVLGNVNYLNPICSNLGIKDLAVVARVNGCFRLAAREIIPIRKFLREGHMLFPKIFSHFSTRRLAKLPQIISPSMEEHVVGAYRIQLQQQKTITIDEIHRYQELLGLKKDYFDPNDFAGVLVSCPNLEKFDIGNSFRYTYAQAQEIALLLKQYCPKLNEVNFEPSYLYGYLDSFGKEVGAVANIIVESFPNLAVLNFSKRDIRNENLSTLLDQSSKLTTLKLGLCTKIDDTGIQDLKKKCPHLTILDLSDTKVSDAGLTSLPSSLISLDLPRAHQITNEGLLEIGGQCPHLKELSLKGCYSITGRGIRTFAENLKQLNTLAIEGCSEVTVEDTIALMKSCPTITSLSPNCREFTDADFERLIPQLSNLTSLQLILARHISEDSLMKLLENCPQLTSLELSGCALISQKCMEAIQKKYPHLSITKQF